MQEPQQHQQQLREPLTQWLARNFPASADEGSPEDSSSEDTLPSSRSTSPSSSKEQRMPPAAIGRPASAQHAAATAALANSSHPVLTSSDTDQHRSPGAAAHVAAATASPAAAGRQAGQGHSQHVAQEPDEPGDLPQQHAQEDAGAGGELSRPDGSDMVVDAAAGQHAAGVAAPQQQVVVKRYKRANQQREKKRREKQQQRAMKQQQMAMMQEQQAVQSQEQQQCGQPGQDEQVPELSFRVWRQHSMQERHDQQHDVEFASLGAAVQEQQEAHHDQGMGAAQNDEVQDTQQQQQQQPDRQVSTGNGCNGSARAMGPAQRLQAQLTANVLQQAACDEQPQQPAHGDLVMAGHDRSGGDGGGISAGGDGSGEGAGQRARPHMHYDPAVADILLDKALQLMGAEVMDWLMETGAEVLPRDGADLLAFLMNPSNPVVTISGMKPGAIKEVLSIMPQQLTPVVVKAFHDARARATGQGGAAASPPPFNKQRRRQQQGDARAQHAESDTDEEGGVTAARDRRRRRSGRPSWQPSPSAKRVKKQQRQQEVQEEEVQPEACGDADSMQQDGVESAHEDEHVMLSKWYQRRQGQQEKQQEPEQEQQQQDGAERGSPSHHFQKSSPPSKQQEHTQQQQPDWSAAFRSWQEQGDGSDMEGGGLGAADDFGMSRQLVHQHEQQHQQQEQRPEEGEREEGHTSVSPVW